MNSYRKSIFSKDSEVNTRLKELGLDKSKLLVVRDRALSQAANASPPLHPANAAGQFAYLEGVYSLGALFIGEDWQIESIRNMEFIKNDNLGVRVGYSNVKLACNIKVEPRARSPKGQIAERVCSHTLDMFADDIPDTQELGDSYLAYFLMVDHTGAVELTCPTIENGNYRNYFERIFLSDGSDFDGEAPLLDDNDDFAGEFDPEVLRR